MASNGLQWPLMTSNIAIWVWLSLNLTCTFIWCFRCILKERKVKRKCATATWGGKKFSLETFLVNIKAYEERVEGRGFCGKASPPHKILQSFRLFFVSASSSASASIFPLMFFILTNRSWRVEKNPFYHHQLQNILGNPRDFLSKKAPFRPDWPFLAKPLLCQYVMKL